MAHNNIDHVEPGAQDSSGSSVLHGNPPDQNRTPAVNAAPQTCVHLTGIAITTDTRTEAATRKPPRSPTPVLGVLHSYRFSRNSTTSARSSSSASSTDRAPSPAAPAEPTRAPPERPDFPQRSTSIREAGFRRESGPASNACLTPAKTPLRTSSFCSPRYRSSSPKPVHTTIPAVPTAPPPLPPTFSFPLPPTPPATVVAATPKQHPQALPQECVRPEQRFSPTWTVDSPIVYTFLDAVKPTRSASIDSREPPPPAEFFFELPDEFDDESCPTEAQVPERGISYKSSTDLQRGIARPSNICVERAYTGTGAQTTARLEPPLPAATHFDLVVCSIPDKPGVACPPGVAPQQQLLSAAPSETRVDIVLSRKKMSLSPRKTPPPPHLSLVSRLADTSATSTSTCAHSDPNPYTQPHTASTDCTNNSAAITISGLSTPGPANPNRKPNSPQLTHPEDHRGSFGIDTPDYPARDPTVPHENLSNPSPQPDQIVSSSSSSSFSNSSNWYYRPAAKPQQFRPNALTPPASSRFPPSLDWDSALGSPSVLVFSEQGCSTLPSPFSSHSTNDYQASDNSLKTTSTVTAVELDPAPIGSTPITDKAHQPKHLNPQTGHSDETDLPLTAYSVDVSEMEDELRALSHELATSIRREMELEDLVERLQGELSSQSQGLGKRTSDYFSDSGASSSKSSFSLYDHNREEVEKVQRKAEQEIAKLRLELGGQLQEERQKRKALDVQIQQLSSKASRADRSQENDPNTSSRLKELDDTCQDLRRRLAEERQSKETLEAVLSTLTEQLQSSNNERDTLRNEIVPQLRSKLEQLESQRPEVLAAAPVAATSGVATPAALARSQLPSNEPREGLSDRLKDVEAQRDALHNALKNLLERHEFLNRENEKKIRSLELERDRLLAESPRKANYEKEVANLRAEITVLRRRAEEAIEQKWQVEKGLDGLKSDLARTEEEIGTLRGLLADAEGSNGKPGSGHPDMSDALEKAYQDLQVSYADALDRINELEFGAATQKALVEGKNADAHKSLQKSLEDAVAERDEAVTNVAALQGQLDALRSSEQAHITSKAELSAKLAAEAARVQQLSSQVAQQLTANSELQQRLSDTITRNEATQKADASRIAKIQERLNQLEKQLVEAQMAAEERVAEKESEIALLRAGHANPSLRRSGITASNLQSLRSPNPLLTKTPLSSPKVAGSPLSSRKRRSGDGDDAEMSTQISGLKDRIAELEKTLNATEGDMQDIVGRMSELQIEVFTLQEERDLALRKTQKLEMMIAEEKAKSAGTKAPDKAIA